MILILIFFPFIEKTSRAGSNEGQSHGDRAQSIIPATERLFEASVIDNGYSASCGLFGKYGHLSCRENKLIMFDNNGSNVIQEWYLHTIRKLQSFKTNADDKGQILTVYLGE